MFEPLSCKCPQIIPFAQEAGIFILASVAAARHGSNCPLRVATVRPGQMPGPTGFDLLGRLEQPPQVIFTTAYDQYALRAFEHHSVDYLLKPIERERLKELKERLGL